MKDANPKRGAVAALKEAERAAEQASHWFRFAPTGANWLALEDALIALDKARKAAAR